MEALQLTCGAFECWSHIPLQDGRKQQRAGPKHLINTDREAYITVAVDLDPSIFFLLQDGNTGFLVQLIVPGH